MRNMVKNIISFIIICGIAGLICNSILNTGITINSLFSMLK